VDEEAAAEALAAMVPQQGLRQGLAEEYDDKCFADVQVVCCGGEMLTVHKLLLASLSPMMRDALEGVPLDSDMVTTVVAPDVEADQLDEFLRSAVQGGPALAAIPDCLSHIDISLLPAQRRQPVAAGNGRRKVKETTVDANYGGQNWSNDREGDWPWEGGEDPFWGSSQNYQPVRKKRRPGRPRRDEAFDYQFELKQEEPEADENGYVELDDDFQPIKKKPKSNVWKFFKPEDERLSCIQCDKTFRKSAGTSTMARHLKASHLHLWQELEAMNKADDAAAAAKKAVKKERIKKVKKEIPDQPEENGEDIGQNDETGENVEVSENGEVEVKVKGEIEDEKENEPMYKTPKGRAVKPRSQVWEHFERTPEGYAACKQCDNKFLINNGTTTTIARHLGRDHPDTYEEVVKDMNERKKPGAAKMTFDWESNSFKPMGAKVKKKSGKRGRPRVHAEEDESSRTCKECGKVFVRKKNMEIHYDAVHAGVKPYKCEQCGRGFARKEGLMRHTHDDARPYVCPTCGKTFGNPRTMEIHERSHSNDRRYQCKYCEKRFITGAQKKVHERIHTGEKPFVCGTCNKAFSAKHQLITHSHIHTGAMPYKCNHCGRFFRYLSTRAKHSCPNRPMAIQPTMLAVDIKTDMPTLPTTTVIMEAVAADDNTTGAEVISQEEPSQQWMEHEEIVYQQQVAQAVESIEAAEVITAPIVVAKEEPEPSEMIAEDVGEVVTEDAAEAVIAMTTMTTITTAAQRNRGETKEEVEEEGEAS